MHPRTHRFWILGSLCLSATWQMARGAEPDSTRPVDGLRRNVPAVYALVGARIIIAPGRELPRGTLVIRDGIITAIDVEPALPSDAARLDMTGKTIYPGLIDAMTLTHLDPLPPDRGLSHWNSAIQPQRRVADHWQPDAGLNRDYRSQGITARLVAPDGGIIKGQSAIVTTGAAPANRAILEPAVAQHVRLTAPRQHEGYPNSPMGAVALARQTFYDAVWYRDVWRIHASQTGLAAPEANAALEALAPCVNTQQLVILDALDEQYLLRGDEFAREFGLQLAFLGSGYEYRRLQAVRDTQRTVIVPVAFPKAPPVATADNAAEVTLGQLMHWDLAPENPARLQQAGVPIALTTHRLEKIADFLPAVRRAVHRGLDPVAALAALTTTPARLLGVESQLGTLERGKRAHLVVTQGDLFQPDMRIEETWVDGQRFVITSSPVRDLRGTWQLTLATEAAPRSLVLDGTPDQLTGRWQGPAPTNSAGVAAPEQATPSDSAGTATDPESAATAAEAKSTATADEEKLRELIELKLTGTQLTARFDLRGWSQPAGIGRLSLTVVKVADEQWKLIGHVVMPDERLVPAVALESVPTTADPSTATNPVNPATSVTPATNDDAPNADAKAQSDPPSSFAVNYPFGEFGRSDPPDQPEYLVLRQATVWTCTTAGILERADVLVRQGVIEQVAARLESWPESATVIDGTGLHLTPGIIDCHSHIATDGGVNESSQAITAEVRIGDFVDATDIAIYRQLAGGVTTANILHGSANPIGGQNQVIKLRWGAAPAELKFRDAPAGIKFALGENVKQSNRGDGGSTRYPQSRMGVEQLVRDAFLAARQYRTRHAEWQEFHRGLPPRRDLELDALAEVQAGQRWVHCHSYRQDEILTLLRTLESLNIQVGTLQHILEGYKVADAIKQHGAMASSFSDWWAYKFEVYDAIPFNGWLMHRLGVVVSFNSDDAELARHLNHEAAKAVKYGGVEPAEALKFVTLNPARQLRIDQYVGSIEPGKQADFVVWNGSPLSPTTRCLQTWIDGRKYFDYDEDRAQRVLWRQMRATLVQKILDTKAPMRSPDEAVVEERDLWSRIDIFCQTKGEEAAR